MNVARNFILVGSAYLILGIIIGMYMGGSGDHSLSILHAHINLLGFTLMAVFGVVYKVFPAMAASGLARLHFWAHTVGTLVLLALLYLLLTGSIGEAAMMPLAPLSELLVLIGVVLFGYNAWKNLS